MVLLPGCGCCGCNFPWKSTISSVDITVQSTGTDVYWSWGANGTLYQCATGYYSVGSAFSYKPPSGVYSLVAYGGARFGYESGDISILIDLAFTQQAATKFSLAVRTGAYGGLSVLHTAGSSACYALASLAPGWLPFTYRFDAYECRLDQSCVTGLYSCSSSKLTYSGGWLSPSVVQTPQGDGSPAEFSLSTWTGAKNKQQATIPTFAGQIVFTDGPENASDNTAYSASLKVTNIVVKYNDGTPDVILL